MKNQFLQHVLFKRKSYLFLLLTCVIVCDNLYAGEPDFGRLDCEFDRLVIRDKNYQDLKISSPAEQEKIKLDAKQFDILIKKKPFFNSIKKKFPPHYDFSKLDPQRKSDLYKNYQTRHPQDIDYDPPTQQYKEPQDFLNQFGSFLKAKGFHLANQQKKPQPQRFAFELPPYFEDPHSEILAQLGLVLESTIKIISKSGFEGSSTQPREIPIGSWLELLQEFNHQCDRDYFCNLPAEEQDVVINETKGDSIRYAILRSYCADQTVFDSPKEMVFWENFYHNIFPALSEKEQKEQIYWVEDMVQKLEDHQQFRHFIFHHMILDLYFEDDRVLSRQKRKKMFLTQPFFNLANKNLSNEALSKKKYLLKSILCLSYDYSLQGHEPITASLMCIKDFYHGKGCGFAIEVVELNPKRIKRNWRITDHALKDYQYLKKSSLEQDNDSYETRLAYETMFNHTLLLCHPDILHYAFTNKKKTIFINDFIEKSIKLLKKFSSIEGIREVSEIEKKINEIKSVSIAYGTSQNAAPNTEKSIPALDQFLNLRQSLINFMGGLVSPVSQGSKPSLVIKQEQLRQSLNPNEGQKLLSQAQEYEEDDSQSPISTETGGKFFQLEDGEKRIAKDKKKYKYLA